MALTNKKTYQNTKRNYIGISSCPSEACTLSTFVGLGDFGPELVESVASHEDLARGSKEPTVGPVYLLGPQSRYHLYTWSPRVFGFHTLTLAKYVQVKPVFALVVIVVELDFGGIVSVDTCHQFWQGLCQVVLILLSISAELYHQQAMGVSHSFLSSIQVFQSGFTQWSTTPLPVDLLRQQEGTLGSAFNKKGPED